MWTAADDDDTPTQFPEPGFARKAMSPCGHPLRSFGDSWGSFSGRRKGGLFLSGDVLFLEAIAAIISIALARMSAEQTLQRSNEELETRVQARNAELVDSNRLLEREIRHRTAIQDRLLLSQQRLELAMRAGNLGFWDWNVATARSFTINAGPDMLGYELNDTEPITAHGKALIHPDDRPGPGEVEAMRERPRNAYEIEYRLGTKSGEWRWILDRAQVVERDDSGRALRMTARTIDVTERKRVEEELHQVKSDFGPSSRTRMTASTSRTLLCDIPM